MILPLMGYVPNPDATARFVSSLPMPTMADAGGDLAESTTDVMLYPALLSCDPQWRRGSQGIGSCVGWGWSLAVDLLASADVICRRENESYGGRTLGASVYALSRVETAGGRPAGMSDGSYGGAAAKAVTQFGTLHYGVDYGGQRFDTYSANREKTFGNTGVPNELEPFAKEHRVQTTTLVRSFAEAAKAIGSAICPVPVCSNQGFSMKRDADGFCKPQGRWSHCMCFAGVRHGKRPGLLCVNSWGASNSGPHYPAAMPEAVAECSFWVDADVCDSMLGGDDSFSIAGFEGFAPRRLPDWLGGII